MLTVGSFFCASRAARNFSSRIRCSGVKPRCRLLRCRRRQQRDELIHRHTLQTVQAVTTIAKFLRHTSSHHNHSSICFKPSSINSPFLPSTSTTSRNQTNLLSRWSTVRRCRSLSCTTFAASIRVNSGNHLSSTASRILVTLSLHPMKHLTSLQERLLRPATSSNHTNRCQTIIVNVPCATRRQPNHRSLRRMTHNRGVSTRRTRKAFHRHPA